MKKVTFILAMLCCPNLFAATLTTNTVPYVCQGGTNPQLCNSKMTTDSNGNLVGLGAWTTKTVGTSYQAATDGFVVLTCNGSGGGSYTYAAISSDGSNPPTTTRSINDVNMGSYIGYQSMGAFSPVRKNDYYEGVCGGDQSSRSSTMYFISMGT